MISGAQALPLRLFWERQFARFRSTPGCAFFSPLGVVARSAPSVITVHDTAFLSHPQSLAQHHRWYWRHVARSWPRADLVLVPSQSTRDQVAGLGIEPARVVVTGEGVDPGFVQRATATDCPSGLEPLLGLLKEPFILFVGSIVPRKNLGLVISAIEQIADATSVRLVVAGNRGAGAPPRGLLKNPPDRSKIDAKASVVELGAVTDDELGWLYRQAQVLVLPSVAEGFGLPALEAMSLGLPVVASAVGALPEVVGEAGVLLPCDDVSRWADELSALLEDAPRRRRLSQLGLAQAERFSWHHAAQMSLQGLDRVLS